MGNTRPTGWMLAALALSGLGACEGTIGGPGLPEAPPPPDVAPQTVPTAPDQVTSTGSCFALEPGERLASVSPEGHAWLLSDGDGATSIRVIDPLDGAELLAETELPEIAALEAWSESDAAVVADGLWRLEGFARVELSSPEGFTLPATLCGDPSDNGFLVAEGQVFERRGDGQWWRWDPNVAPEAAPKTLVTYDGECVGLDNFLWATATDGTLWRIDGAEAAAPVRFETLKSAAATRGALAVLDADRLWLGPEPWSAWIFPGEHPEAISAASGAIWMMSGAQLLRLVGTEWQEVSHDLSEPLTALEAHAGGVWLAGATEICHQAVGPLVRVEGIRPFERTGEAAFDFRVRTNVAEMSLEATLDGEPLSLGPDAEEGWLVARGELADVGWHELTLVADGEVTARTIEVKRLPTEERSWAEDIEPIYQTNCALGDCHGSDEAPDMGSYEAWKDNAAKIRTRVVDAKTMPPAGSQGPDWSDAQIAIIAQWLEGGMLP